MGGHVGLCAMGSFIILIKSGRFNKARKGGWEGGTFAVRENKKFWLGIGLVCDVPCYVFGWLPEWDRLIYPVGVLGGVVCGVMLGDRLGFPTKDSPIKDEPIMVEEFCL